MEELEHLGSNLYLGWRAARAATQKDKNNSDYAGGDEEEQCSGAKQFVGQGRE